MERCRIKGVEELHNGREFDLDDDPALVFFIQ
jgi:hypothetical protein